VEAIVRNDLLAVLVSLGLAGCSSGAGETVSLSPDGDSADSGTEGDLRGEDRGISPDAAEATEVAAPQDVGSEWDFQPDVAAPCLPGEGCFLDKCSAPEQCQSGWCVDHMGEGVCTVTCSQECPAGWSCSQVTGVGRDLLFVCVSNHTNLCRPCSGATECKDVSGQEDACVDYGAEGSFCGSKCALDEDCPWGFSCGTAVTVDGVELKQCVAEAGVCPCTTKSVELGLWTPCEVSTGAGTCAGKRVCTADGLSDCDASTPAAETCNGADDDCDGETDEPAQVDGNYVSLCDDANPCTADACAGESGCGHDPLEEGECIDGDVCTVGDHCTAGACGGSKVLCDDSNPCTDDACDGLGGCSFAVNQADCDDQDPCTVADQCDSGVCEGVAVPCDCLSDKDCDALENGDACDGTLVCSAQQWPYKCIVDPATVIVCPGMAGKDAICLAPACDAASGMCSLVAEHEGFACDDGDACTVGDECAAGVCLPGAPPICKDDNPCTDDACDPDTGCQFIPNAAPCNDLNVCTLGDVCGGGQCMPGPGKLACNDANVCTDDACGPGEGCTHAANLAECDDENACTVGDHCGNGQCLPGSMLAACDDANPCTNDSCNPDTGCYHTFNTLPCSDGDPCTLNDLCGKGVCVSGPTVQCDDGNPCTDDSCGANGICEHAANSAQCDDGNMCTTGDKCSGGKCTFGAALDCDDANLCTTDSCNPLTGCVFSNNANPCEDGSLCTAFDKCAGGVCVAGPELVCSDANVCTDDGCDPKIGCAYTANVAACSDNNKCTDGDVCSGGTCQPGGALGCDDANNCTADGCEPAAGCGHVPLPDGTQCGGPQEHCKSGVCVSCVPSCAGKSCGDDGCGGSCGSCPGYAPCSPGLGYCVQDKIYIIAQNNARNGAMGGLAGADAVCQSQAQAHGFNRTFVAYLCAQGRDLATLFKSGQSAVPVVNRENQTLFSNWNELFQNYGTHSNSLYAFDGKLVDEGTGASPDWEDADCWHGCQPNGTTYPGLTCDNWNNSGATGVATELDGSQLLGQETSHACTQNLAVLCISVAP